MTRNRCLKRNNYETNEKIAFLRNYVNFSTKFLIHVYIYKQSKVIDCISIEKPVLHIIFNVIDAGLHSGFPLFCCYRTHFPLQYVFIELSTKITFV